MRSIIKKLVKYPWTSVQSKFGIIYIDNDKRYTEYQRALTLTSPKAYCIDSSIAAFQDRNFASSSASNLIVQ